MSKQVGLGHLQPGKCNLSLFNLQEGDWLLGRVLRGVKGANGGTWPCFQPEITGAAALVSLVKGQLNAVTHTAPEGSQFAKSGRQNGNLHR